MTEVYLSMSVGRDYRTSSQYEYVIFQHDEIVARQGFFKTSTQAKRAGFKAAQAIEAANPQLSLF